MSIAARVLLAKKKEQQQDEESIAYEQDVSNAGQKFDLNAVKVKIIILCDDEEKTSSIGNFLNRRGWQAMVTSNVGVLIKQIGAIMPDIVMVSVNIRMTTPQDLLKRIHQAFNLPVILFGERQDAITLKLLSDVPAQYSIQGHASGPVIHRKIQSLVQELYGPMKEKELREQIDAESSSKTRDNIHIIRGAKPESGASCPSPIVNQGTNVQINRADTNQKIVEPLVARAEEEAHKKTMCHIFERCALAACEAEVGPTQTLPLAESCSVWPILMAKKMGALMIVQSGDERKQQEFTHKFFKQLNKEIHTRAKQISYGDEVPISLRGVDLSLSVVGEILSCKMRFGQNTVLIKFIEGINYSPPVVSEDPSHQDKAKINLSDLTVERKLGVNLYLHMPVNAKYFLYLKSEAILSLAQYEKMNTTRPSLYINTEDINKYKEFVIRNKLAKLLKK